MIDKNTPIPLYFQLMQNIKRAIDSGELIPGDAIPTEVELMERYGISRATVRQAVLRLVNEGYLRRIKAKGTFVNTPPEKPLFLGSLKGFAEEMAEKGVDFRTEVLDQRIIPADPEVAERLLIATGDPVFYLKRVRFVQDEPVILVDGYMPAGLFRHIEEEDFEKNSLYDLLGKKYGVFLHHGWREFGPVLPASEEEMRLLGIGSRNPILAVESVVYTKNNTPVEYIDIRMRGKFRVELFQRKQI